MEQPSRSPTDRITDLENKTRELEAKLQGVTDASIAMVTALDRTLKALSEDPSYRESDVWSSIVDKMRSTYEDSMSESLQDQFNGMYEAIIRMKPESPTTSDEYRTVKQWRELHGKGEGETSE